MPTPLIDRAAVAAVLALPLALLTTRTGAEALIAATDVLFLGHLVRSRLSLLLTPVVAASAAWWAWTVLASSMNFQTGGSHAVIQSLLMGRFFIFAAALSEWLLRRDAVRRALGAAVALAASWIAIECWQQFFLGTNIFGWPRFGDGALTGPFLGPKAGPMLVLILFPALLPPVMALLGRPVPAARIGAALLALTGVATVILIGQRMPALLTILGLVTCGVLLRPIRPIVLAIIALSIAFIAATPLISPPTFNKLVVKFTHQMGHFGQSPYGLIYIRATVITLAHPWLGFGFDGYRAVCDAQQYQHSLPWLGIPDQVAASPDGCNIHPHNHYFEAATSGGFPGLALFCATVLAWLAALGRGLLARPSVERAGLFAAALIGLWPLASTSAFFTVPNAGWTFLLLGWGLALSPRPDAASARQLR